MKKGSARAGVALLAGLLPVACASVYRLPLAACPSHLEPNASRKVVVKYLGVGGFLLRRGTDALLTAPLYSNPSLVEVGADHRVASDAELIDALLGDEARDAKAILVGHSHYDHLMDVPYIARHKAKAANIYGSVTTQRLLAPLARELRSEKPERGVIALEAKAGDHETGGEWIPLGPGVRFMALRSEHSPQLTLKLPSLFKKDPRIPVHLWRGEQEKDRKDVPRSASDWVQGRVFAFVIDFLSGSSVVFRIYYQDSGTNAPIGHVPPALLLEKEIDLAILCLGGDFHRLKGHPEGILDNLKPRFVVLSHWEDFFVNQKLAVEDGAFQGLPSADLFAPGQTKVFLKRARRAQAPYGREPWLPCPSRSVFEFALP